MQKKRPFGVTLLAILTGIASVAAIVHTLQMLHLFPISVPLLGQAVTFFTFDLLGAILWGLLAAIWVWVTRMLWNVDAQGWLFAAALSTLNLIMAFVSLMGQTTIETLLPTFFINGLVLIYCLLPSTKAAFGVS
jgi:hypothetical protein